MSDQVITPSARAAPSIPDYELLRPIGRGAYGEVWLARNVTGSWVALKIVHRSAFDHDRPFEREFEGIKRFEPVSRCDPSQVAILHVGLGDGFFYYVMELADDVAAEVTRLNSKSEIRNQKSEIDQSLSINLKVGRVTPCAPFVGSVASCGAHGVTRPTNPATYQPKTLKRLLNDCGALPAQECLAIAFSLTRALAHLHGHGLVHRDVKPSNVIFVNGQAKLADIGLVTSVDATRSFVGTEGYLPPEGAGTPQADLYSLGKVLYEMSTGCDRKEFPALPPDIATRPDRDALAELNAIVVRACQHNPRERYANAVAIETDLALLQRGRSVRRTHQVKRGWHLARRGVAWVAAGAAAFALIVFVSRVRQPTNTSRVEKRSTNEVANRFYDLGVYYFDKSTGQGFEAAATNFEQAIRADPGFAQAYSSLSRTYARSLNNEWNEGWKFLPKAKEAALEALKPDPSLAEPHLALAWYKAVKEWAWSDAEHEYQRAMGLNPSDSCHALYAEFLRMAGRTNEALREMTQALDLNPRSMWLNGRMVDVLAAARRFQEAITQADQAIAMEPRRSQAAHAHRIRALCALGRYPEAIEEERELRFLNELRFLKGETKEKIDVELAQLKRAVEAEGHKAYWRWKLADADGPYWQARAYAQMGETEEAVVSLQEALKDRDTWLTFHVMTDWTLDPVRSDPRFGAILKQMHLK